jgi:NUMOD4 motif
MCKTKEVLMDEMVDEVDETWRVINEFPDYVVSNYGNVMSIATEKLISTSQVTGGAVRVGLQKDKKQYSRSVKVLVATAFVPGKDSIFNTPVLLDGFPQHLEPSNIVWRPRWFAWQYLRQLSAWSRYHYLGPVYDLKTGEVYATIFEAATVNGLLVRDIWGSIQSRTYTFPTRQEFRLVDKTL